MNQKIQNPSRIFFPAMPLPVLCKRCRRGSTGGAVPDVRVVQGRLYILLILFVTSIPTWSLLSPAYDRFVVYRLTQWIDTSRFLEEGMASLSLYCHVARNLRRCYSRSRKALWRSGHDGNTSVSRIRFEILVRYRLGVPTYREWVPICIL